MAALRRGAAIRSRNGLTFRERFRGIPPVSCRHRRRRVSANRRRHGRHAARSADRENPHGPDNLSLKICNFLQNSVRFDENVENGEL